MQVGGGRPIQTKGKDLIVEVCLTFLWNSKEVTMRESSG